MYEEISKNFGQTVNELLNNGYQFHFLTMTGHQGEVTKIDLYKGKEVIRVSLYETSDVETDCNKIIMYVGRWNKHAFTSDTAWQKDFEILTSKTWYQVSRWSKRHEWYTDDVEFAKKCSIKKQQRMSLKRNTTTIVLQGKKYQEIAKRFLKRKNVAKRFNDKIEVRKYYSNNQVKYRIFYKNCLYPLSLKDVA